LYIGIEKVDLHEKITVKALFNSGVTELFINKKLAEKKGFSIRKLKGLIRVRNVDRTENSRGAITYEIECNMYF